MKRLRKNKHNVTSLFIISIMLLEILTGLVGCRSIKPDNRKVEENSNKIDSLVKDDERAEEISPDDLNKMKQEQIRNILPGIVCIGDSLTYGFGGEGTSYPMILQEEMKKNGYEIPVINLGACGEDSITIAGRNGGIPYVVGEDFDLPAEMLEVPISIVSSDRGRKVMPSLFTDIGINECNIGGISGTIKIQNKGDINSQYTFIRKERGSQIHVAAGTQIITAATGLYDKDIPIVFMGTNGGFDSYMDLVTQLNGVIGARALNDGKYLVIGITTGDRESMKEYDQVMYDTYQEHYFNLREYLSVSGMYDAGIAPTTEDLAYMQSGMVPPSLRCDLAHFSRLGYEVVGKAVYYKLVGLGYFDEVSEILKEDNQTEDFRKDAFTFTNEIQAGINIGNALDAYGCISCNEITQYETFWNNPVITEQLFKTIKDAGFKTVRIPITWQEHCDSDFSIDEKWLERIKLIVDYARNQDLYVIINIHHDQWMEPSYKNMYRAVYGTKRIWSQVAETFCDYDEHLIFEGFNEPRLFDPKLEWGNGNAESYYVINQMMQCFVDTVRDGKRYNKSRFLMLTAYRAGDQLEMLRALKIPEDPNLLLSVHLYIPYEFALKNDGTSKWSSSSQNDTLQIDTSFDTMQTIMNEKNIPVVITEFGAVDKENEQDQLDWCKYITGKARNMGIPYIWWDNNYPAYYGEGMALIDRKENKIVKPEIVKILVGSSE